MIKQLPYLLKLHQSVIRKLSPQISMSMAIRNALDFYKACPEKIAQAVSTRLLSGLPEGELKRSSYLLSIESIEYYGGLAKRLGLPVEPIIRLLVEEYFERKYNHDETLHARSAYESDPAGGKAPDTQGHHRVL